MKKADNLQTYEYIYKKVGNVLNITGTVDVDIQKFKITFEVSDLKENFNIFIF